MRSDRRTLPRIPLALSALIFAGLFGTVSAGSHLWAPVEVYSNADGTIQFVELHCPPDAPNEVNVSARYLKAELSGNQTPPFGNNLPAGSTADKRLLYATAGFASLPGAPTPDYVMIDGFVGLDSERLRWWEYTFDWSTMTYGPGDLPVGGDDALYWDGIALSTGTASPTNFDGAGFAPPGVSGLTVGKLVPDGSELTLSWDDAGCLGAHRFQIAHGFGSQLPASLGEGYGLQPEDALAHCDLSGSPVAWVGVPDPSADSSNLLWFMIVAEDGGTTEGSLGLDGAGGERTGPGVDGSTGQCGNLTKNLTNTCGQ